MGLQDEINRLRQEKQALIKEFTDQTSENPEATPAYVHKQLTSFVADALQQISFLLNHAESETTRATLARYVIDAVRNPLSPGGADAGLQKLLADLKKPNPSPSPTNTP